MILTLARKELYSLFAMPSTWFLLGGLQFIFAWFFLLRLDDFLQVQTQFAQIANAPGATQAVVAPVFVTLGLILLMLVPMFTMRLLAEERRNQTLTLLLTAPISELQIVLGKFIGLLLFLLLVIAGCTLMVLTLSLGTHLDMGLLLCNALGLVLLVAAYAALGLYASSLTSHPAIAAISSLAVLFGLLLLDMSVTSSNNLWRALTPTSHFHSFNMGLFNSADLVYFVLFSGVFLALTVRRLRNNRLYG